MPEKVNILLHFWSHYSNIPFFSLLYCHSEYVCNQVNTKDYRGRSKFLCICSLQYVVQCFLNRDITYKTPENFFGHLVALDHEIGGIFARSVHLKLPESSGRLQDCSREASSNTYFHSHIELYGQSRFWMLNWTPHKHCGTIAVQTPWRYLLCL